MVRAWYRAESGDDRGTMMLDPGQFVPVDEMMRKTGVRCLQFKAESWDTDAEYKAFKDRKQYTYEDTIEITREGMPDYEIQVKNFASEHIHPDEEIRFVLDGTGYFDIRDWDDRWIRLEASKGDLLIIPAGVYHRFVLDKKNFMRVKRLFEGVPRWTAFFRPDGDDHPARIEYLRNLAEVRRLTSDPVSGNNGKAG
ncbi:hypothetical protein BsWGS_26809 [Bradybaena similaris]